jgi:GNAT superfamily N-acetyltransferase
VSAVTATALDIAPVRAADWAALADLFGPSGGYSGCWCTWWRQTQADFDAGCRDGAAGNRALLARLTADGAVPGLMAYDGSGPVGWVSVAPRVQFGRVLRSPTLKPRPGRPGEPGEPPADDPGVWTMICFWVPRGERGHGVGTALLAGAVAWARESGARLLEGYPVQTRGKEPSAGLYTGTVTMFEQAGFTVVRGPSGGGRRSVVRCDL